MPFSTGKKKWASNVLSGFGRGTSLALTGVAKGIGGVVYEPYKGAKEKGFKGGAKGVGKGLAGFVTKPLKGGFEFFAQPIVGLGNTPSFLKKKMMKKKNGTRDTNF